MGQFQNANGDHSPQQTIAKHTKNPSSDKESFYSPNFATMTDKMMQQANNNLNNNTGNPLIVKSDSSSNLTKNNLL